MELVLAWIGAVVVAGIAAVGLLYAVAFVSWVYYWRFGKGHLSGS